MSVVPADVVVVAGSVGGLIEGGSAGGGIRMGDIGGGGGFGRLLPAWFAFHTSKKGPTLASFIKLRMSVIDGVRATA